MEVLRRGAKGEDVKRLQSLLKTHGSPGLAVDGDFGPATETAVRHFQSEHKLAVDGVVGPQTWAALTGGTPPVPHEQRIKQAVAFFSKHWSQAQAIGIVANLDAESGMDPGIHQQGGGPGYGLAQWEGPRQLEFQRWAHRSIEGSSFDQQLEFVQYELTHTESDAGDSLKHDKTAEDAAETITRKYERPAKVNEAVAYRRTLAKQIESRIAH